MPSPRIPDLEARIHAQAGKNRFAKDNASLMQRIETRFSGLDEDSSDRLLGLITDSAS